MQDLQYIYKLHTEGLTADEQAAFEKRLLADGAFRQKVEDYQLIFDGLRGMRHEAFRKQVEEWPKTPEPANRESIPDYLTGKLPDAAQQAFEKQLAEDASLSGQVEDYRLMLEGLKGMQHEAFRQKVEGWAKEETVDRASAGRRFLRPVYYAAAAVLLLLIVFAGMRWYAQANFSSEALAMQYYSPRKTPATLSGQMDAFQSGYNAYKAGDYANATAFFGQVAPASPRYAESQLFLGYALFESGRYAPAIQAFERTMAAGEQRFADNAEWHLLLAYLRQEPSSPRVDSLLSQIAATTGHAFQDEAIALRKRKGSLWRKLAADS